MTAADDTLALEFLADDDARSLRMFRLGSDLVVCFWHAVPTDVALVHLSRCLRGLADAQEPRFSLLNIVSGSVPVLPDYARSAFVDLMREHSDRLACVGVVLEGSGFWAGLMQSVSTGMRLLARGSFAMFVDSSIERIAGRVAEAHGGALDESTLVAALERARATTTERRA